MSDDHCDDCKHLRYIRTGVFGGKTYLCERYNNTVLHGHGFLLKDGNNTPKRLYECMKDKVKDTEHA